MADSMEPRKMLWGRPLLPWQRNFGLGAEIQSLTGLSFLFARCRPTRPRYAIATAPAAAAALDNLLVLDWI